MSDRLKQMLIKHEGIKLKPYKCTMGFVTIGIGRNLDANGISELEAIVMLDNDIAEVKKQVEKKFKWFNKLNDVRKDVIIDMVFNMGLKTFCEFKMTIHFLEEGDFAQASIEMLESDWSTQVGCRAKELSKMMYTGEYPK